MNEFTLSELRLQMLLPHGKRAVCLTLIHFLGQSKVICAQRGFSPNGETQSNAMCQLLLSVFTMSTSLSHTPQLPSPLRHLNLFTTYNTHTHTEGSKLFVVYFIFLLGLVKSTKKRRKKKRREWEWEEEEEEELRQNVEQAASFHAIGQ